MTPSDRRERDLARLEERYGPAREITLRVPMHEWEFHLLRYSKRDGRFRDATILIPRDGRLVCIVKHGYPEGVARPPSGGVVPGEALDAAAEREAWEETGLRVQIERYLLRVRCTFTLGDAEVPPENALAEANAKRGGEGWDFSEIEAFAAANPVKPGAEEYWESHVFWAEAHTGRLEPRDTREVREVRLVDPGELEGEVHARMREAGIGGFAYRVLLHEEALAAARDENLLR